MQLSSSSSSSSTNLGGRGLGGFGLHVHGSRRQALRYIQHLQPALMRGRARGYPQATIQLAGEAADAAKAALAWAAGAAAWWASRLCNNQGLSVWAAGSATPGCRPGRTGLSSRAAAAWRKRRTQGKAVGGPGTPAAPCTHPIGCLDVWKREPPAVACPSEYDRQPNSARRTLPPAQTPENAQVSLTCASAMAARPSSTRAKRRSARPMTAASGAGCRRWWRYQEPIEDVMSDDGAQAYSGSATRRM